jgi:branched-chain amino acid transport system permease protein
MLLFLGVTHRQFTLAILAEIVAALAIGATLYALLLRRLTGQGPLIPVMLTIALGTVIQAVVGMVWGTSSQFLALPFGKSGLRLPAGVTLSELDISIILGAAILLTAVGVVIRFTDVGLMMRAAAENPLLASYRGVRVGVVSATAWAIATVATFAAGIAFGAEGALDISVVGLAFVGFAAILIGGLDSLPGVVLGSIILALVQSLVVTLLGGAWSDVVAYVLLLGTLLVRPYGLLGTPEFLRV